MPVKGSKSGARQVFSSNAALALTANDLGSHPDVLSFLASHCSEAQVLGLGDSVMRTTESAEFLYIGPAGMAVAASDVTSGHRMTASHTITPLQVVDSNAAHLLQGLICQLWNHE